MSEIAIMAAIMVGSLVLARVRGKWSKAFMIWLAILTVVAVGSMTAAALHPEWAPAADPPLPAPSCPDWRPSCVI